MKDQYAGDINDYRKYGLLRALAGEGGLSLGVCWMLTGPDGRSDGKHTSYLSRGPQWRAYDPELFDAMTTVGAAPERSVGAVERSGVLGSARFWSEIVPDGAAARGRYFAGVAEWAAGVDVVFFDPDNGLEVPSTGPGRRGSGKYLLWNEAEETFRRGHSLLIYQHFPRRERAGFIADLATRLAERTQARAVAALVTAHVVFFLVMQTAHEERCVRALDAVSRRWGEQIRVERCTR